MTCAEFKQLAAAMALGALDPDERAACEAHLAEPAHEGCPEALRAAMATVGALPLALPPVAPPPATWRAIEARVAPRRGAPRWVAAAGWIAAAAAALAAIWFYRRGDALHERAALVDRELLATTERVDRCARELDAALRESAARAEAVALVELPATRVVPLAPQAGATQRATAIVNEAEGRAVVVGRNLVPQTDKDYELWVIRGEEKLPAGLLHAGEDGVLTLVVDRDLLAGGVDAFAITLEPAGGGPVPRGPILLVAEV